MILSSLQYLPQPTSGPADDDTILAQELDDGSDIDIPMGDSDDSDDSVANGESEADEQPVQIATTPIGQFKITGYCLRGTTRAGTYTTYGTAATDRRVIPAYTRFEVEGMGTYTSLDTGSAVIGRHIDLWFDNCISARQWGVRYRNVWIRTTD